MLMYKSLKRHSSPENYQILLRKINVQQNHVYGLKTFLFVRLHLTSGWAMIPYTFLFLFGKQIFLRTWESPLLFLLCSVFIINWCGTLSHVLSESSEMTQAPSPSSLSIRSMILTWFPVFVVSGHFKRSFRFRIKLRGWYKDFSSPLAPTKHSLPIPNVPITWLNVTPDESAFTRHGCLRFFGLL